MAVMGISLSLVEAWRCEVTVLGREAWRLVLLVVVGV
jgi:hypothetical protein